MVALPVDCTSVAALLLWCGMETDSASVDRCLHGVWAVRSCAVCARELIGSPFVAHQSVLEVLLLFAYIADHFMELEILLFKFRQ